MPSVPMSLMPYLGLGAFFVLGSQVYLTVSLERYDQMRVFQGAVLCIFGISFILYKTEILWCLASRRSRVLCALMLVCGVVSSSLSQWGFEGLVETARIGALMAVSVVLAGQLVLAPNRIRFALNLVVLASSAALVLSRLLEWGWMMADGKADTIELFWPFANRRFFGHLAVFVMPVLTAICISSARESVVRVASILLAVGMGGLCIACGSRGSWLATLIGLATVSVVFPERSRAFVMHSLGIWICSVFFYFVIFVVVPCWLSIDVLREDRIASLLSGSLSGRDVLWVRAWEYIQASPIFGVGPMAFSADGDLYGAHPHNIVLQLGAEWGSLALLAAMALSALVGGRVLRGAKLANNFENSMLIVALSSAVAGGLVLSMVDGVFVVPASELWFFVCTGWLVGECRLARQKGKEQPPLMDGWQAGGYWHAVFSGALVAGLFIQGAFIVNEVPRLSAKVEEQSANPKYPNTVFPRYWLAGRIE